MKLEQGDLFERSHAKWLRENLRGNRDLGYETVWQNFFGNDGKSVPLALGELDENTQTRRQKFVEGHYSMAVAAFLFDQVAQRMAVPHVPHNNPHSPHEQSPCTRAWCPEQAFSEPRFPACPASGPRRVRTGCRRSRPGAAVGSTKN